MKPRFESAIYLGAAVLARAMIEPDADIVAMSSAMTGDARLIEPSQAATVYAEMRQEYTASLQRMIEQKESAC